MPATPARIGFVLEEWRRARIENDAMRSRYGKLARESDDPVETFFDNVTDAETMAQARMDLLGVERRRFSVRARGLDEALTLSFTGGSIPVATLTDTEKDFSGPVILATISFDFDTQQCEFTPWG